MYYLAQTTLLLSALYSLSAFASQLDGATGPISGVTTKLALAKEKSVPITLPPSSPYGDCTDYKFPVAISEKIVDLSHNIPSNQLQLTALATNLSSNNIPPSSFVGSNIIPIDINLDIHVTACVPSDFKNGTLEIFVSPDLLGSAYYTSKVDDSSESALDIALKNGSAVLLYDRPGTGQSTKPNGGIIQLPVEREVLVQVANKTKAILPSTKTVAVGLGSGSDIIVGAVSKYGNIFDGVVLTGFSTFLTGRHEIVAAAGLSLANKSPVYSSLDNSYVTLGGFNAAQMLFLYGDFEPSERESLPLDPFSLAKFLAWDLPRANGYSKPVRVVLGERDFFACGGNCRANSEGYANIAQAARSALPTISDYEAYIVPNAGHALNAHRSAPETNAYIQEQIAKF